MTEKEASENGHTVLKEHYEDPLDMSVYSVEVESKFDFKESVLENSVAISSQEKWEIIHETVAELKLVERYTWRIVGETTGTASESDDHYETYEEALAMGRGWLHEIRSELREDEDYTVLVTTVAL